MKSRALSLVLSGLLMCAASAFAQQGTTEVKGKVVDTQSAARTGSDGRRQEPGDRDVPRDRQRR